MILKIKKILRQKKISNLSLAEKINVSPQTISNIINERSFPNLKTLIQIAKALNVDLRDLFYSNRSETESELLEEIQERLDKLKKLQDKNKV